MQNSNVVSRVFTDKTCTLVPKSFVEKVKLKFFRVDCSFKKRSGILEHSPKGRWMLNMVFNNTGL